MLEKSQRRGLARNPSYLQNKAIFCCRISEKGHWLHSKWRHGLDSIPASTLQSPKVSETSKG